MTHVTEEDHGGHGRYLHVDWYDSLRSITCWTSFLQSMYTCMYVDGQTAKGATEKKSTHQKRVWMYLIHPLIHHDPPLVHSLIADTDPQDAPIWAGALAATAGPSVCAGSQDGK